MTEAKSAAALDHPFACKVHETGEVDGRPYIVMQFVDGITLKERLARGPIPQAEAVRIELEVSEAAETAHRHGLVHRDLKPSNIMLAPGGHVKVMDFGLATRVPSEAAEQASTTMAVLTEAGVAVGTLAYMSPEQLLGQDIDARSDIFSAGVVFYEVLTGVNPFLRSAPMATASAILNEPPAPMTRYIESVPEVLQHTVKRMLARDREQRFSSIHEVRTNLAELLRGSQEVASPREVPAVRRRPIVARIAALVVLLAVGAAACWAYDRLFVASTSVLAFQARDWILIVDFDNQTGDPVFDRSLKTALTVGIQQSRCVNVFPDGRVQEALQRMRKPAVERIDEALGGEIALREGIKGLLACSIGRAGEVYSLTARVVDPDTRATVLAEAVKAFEMAHRLKPSGYTLEALAVANLRLRRTAEAIARFEDLLKQDQLGEEGQDAWILAHYEVGKLYEETDDTVKARERYEQFLEIWKNADPEIRVVADARARLARLARSGLDTFQG